jgi:hypothetical protein
MIRESELAKVIVDGGKSPGRPRKEAETGPAPETGQHRSEKG